MKDRLCSIANTVLPVLYYQYCIGRDCVILVMRIGTFSDSHHGAPFFLSNFRKYG